MEFPALNLAGVTCAACIPIAAPIVRMLGTGNDARAMALKQRDDVGGVMLNGQHQRSASFRVRAMGPLGVFLQQGVELFDRR